MPYLPAKAYRSFGSEFCRPFFYLLLLQFDRRAVGQNFGGGLREFGRVITHSDNSIGADHLGMMDHSIERLDARLFANRSEFLDISAGDRFEPADKSSSYPRRPHHYPAHDTAILHYLFSRYLVTCRHDHIFRSTFPLFISNASIGLKLPKEKAYRK